MKYTYIYTPMLSNIKPNWDFWHENKPSGNPAPCRWKKLTNLVDAEDHLTRLVNFVGRVPDGDRSEAASPQNVQEKRPGFIHSLPFDGNAIESGRHLLKDNHNNSAYQVSYEC
jgi:hypothetical protein